MALGSTLRPGPKDRATRLEFTFEPKRPPRGGLFIWRKDMSAPSYGSRWPTYAKQWDAMTILPARLSEVRQVAKRLADAKPRYQAVEKATGVPWYMIAAIHERESSQSWKASLAQGDPWDRVSTHVPRGRGPLKSWEAAAIDALELDGLTKVIDWRLEKILYFLELYNGWGYHSH